MHRNQAQSQAGQSPLTTLRFDVWILLLQPQCMNPRYLRVSAAPPLWAAWAARVLRVLLALALLACIATQVGPLLHAAESGSDAGWRAVPLIADGKVAPSWKHVGWG